MDSACPLRHCCCVHVRQLRGLGPTSCRALSGQTLHPLSAGHARFRSLFWARWALHQKGLPKDVCRYITRNYLTRAAFHDETVTLRQERIAVGETIPFWLHKFKPFLTCLKFETELLHMETGRLVIRRCLIKRSHPYGTGRFQSRLAKKCQHKRLWARVKNPPAEQSELVWRDGVCVVRTSSSLAEPYGTLALEEEHPLQEPQEPPLP